MVVSQPATIVNEQGGTDEQPSFGVDSIFLPVSVSVRTHILVHCPWSRSHGRHTKLCADLLHLICLTTWARLPRTGLREERLDGTKDIQPRANSGGCTILAPRIITGDHVGVTGY